MIGATPEYIASQHYHPNKPVIGVMSDSVTGVTILHIAAGLPIKSRKHQLKTCSNMSILFIRPERLAINPLTPLCALVYFLGMAELSAATFTI
jgi:hypothetical protein